MTKEETKGNINKTTVLMNDGSLSYTCVANLANKLFGLDKYCKISTMDVKSFLLGAIDEKPKLFTLNQLYEATMEYRGRYNY